MTARREAALLALILAVALGLRLAAIGADPPYALSRSNTEVTDGPWYAAEAADAALGREVAVQEQYRRPLFTAMMRVAFAGGVSLERAHAAAAVAGALLVLLAFGAARTAYGRPTALLAALLLAVGFAPVGYGRATVVYGPLAAGVAGVFWLLAAGLRAERTAARAAFGALAWALLFELAYGIQAVALVAAPALVAGQVLAARWPGRALATLAIVGAVGVAGAVLAAPDLAKLTVGKALGYFGDAAPDEVLKRWLRGPFASGLFPLAPLIALAAWTGVFAALAPVRPDASRGERALDVALAVGFAGWLAVFSLFAYTEGGVDPPLRYFFPALVPGAILAARVLVRAASPEGLALPAARPLLFAWALLGCYWALGAALQAARPLLLDEEGGMSATVKVLVSFRALIAVAGVTAVLAAAVWHERLRDGRPVRISRAATLLLVGLGLAADAAYLAPALLRPRYTLQSANRVVAQILGEGARAYGNWAHALTYDAPHVRRELPSVRVQAFLAEAVRGTHLFIDVGYARDVERLFRARGVELVPIAHILVRDHPVALYRFPWAAERWGYRPTALELECESRMREAGGS